MNDEKKTNTNEEESAMNAGLDKGADASEPIDLSEPVAGEPTVSLEDIANDGAADSELQPEQSPLEAAEAQAEENWNKYLRGVAELENVRKRSARDVERARLFGVEKLAESLLEVADSLEMALEVSETATVEALLEGSHATLKQLRIALEKHGIASVYPEGEPFDPEFHEAMSMVESDTAEPNSVMTVVQRGYQLNGRLLRPARVVVAKESSVTSKE